MIFREPLYHNYNTYIKIHLEKSDTCDPWQDDTPEQSPTYSNIFEFYAEWKSQGQNLIQNLFPLMFSWAYIIHELQGKTLFMEVFDIGKGEKWSGTTLVSLSHVYKLENFLLHPFSFERLDKVNT